MPIKRRPEPSGPREFFQRENNVQEKAHPDIVRHYSKALIDRIDGSLSEVDFNKVISGSVKVIHEHDLRPSLVNTGRVNQVPGPTHLWEQYEVRFHGEVCSCPIGELWLPPGPASVDLLTQILEMICLK